jgi:hypothetical protein
MQTAEVLRSDIALAGLMLRCSGATFELLTVLLEPIPPRARPQVTLAAGSERVQFEGRTATPSTTILLPQEAVTLLTGPWQSRGEISVAVKHEDTSIQGVVSLAGLRPAYETLKAACTKPLAR